MVFFVCVAFEFPSFVFVVLLLLFVFCLLMCCVVLCVVFLLLVLCLLFLFRGLLSEPRQQFLLKMFVGGGGGMHVL